MEKQLDRPEWNWIRYAAEYPHNSSSVQTSGGNVYISLSWDALITILMETTSIRATCPWLAENTLSSLKNNGLEAGVILNDTSPRQLWFKSVQQKDW